MRKKSNDVGVFYKFCKTLWWATANGQQKEVFWERVTIHYNNNWPIRFEPKK
jgi:hypothetical protein